MPFGTGGEFTGGGSGGGGGGATSVTAGDASLVISPNTGAVVATTGTLDQIANLHSAVANWSNNGHAITGLADIALTGLTGATNATRFVGGTASGAPVSGTFNAGDFVIDASGAIWICTAGGTPGTWASGGAASTLVAPTGETGAVAAVKFVGGTNSGAPSTGTFNTGDYIIDRTGFIWICTSGGSPGTWVQPSISSISTAFQIALTETINYPPVARLSGNTGFLEQQNPTMGRLPPISSISASGSTWTITFSASVLGTLGNIGDTFQIWTQDFVPSGWNYGNSLVTHTATITASNTATVANATSPAAITTFGLAYTPNIITTGIGGIPGGEFQLEGTTTFNQSISNLYGIGPAFQTQKTYTNGPVYTATWNVTNGSNSISISGDQRANVLVGLFLIAGANFPLNSVINTAAYNGTNTVVTLVNTLNGLAANYTGSTGTESITFAAAIAPGEAYVGAGFLTGTQAGVTMIPNAGNFAGPGAGQGWGDPFSLSYNYNRAQNVMDAGMQIAPIFRNGAQGQLSLPRFQGADTVFSDNTSSLGMQMGSVPLSALDYNIPNATVAPASGGTALSSLSTLNVQVGVVPFPTQGSAVIPASDGMHIVSWTGGTATAVGNVLSAATLTGCTYSGDTTATVTSGALLSCIPQFRQPKSPSPAGVFGSVKSVGLLNPSSTFNPSQAPATTIASGSNGIVGTNLVTATGTINSADNGVAFSGLGTLTLNAASTAFGSSGIGTIAHGGKTYVFSWTGQSGSTLTGCVYSGLQSTTVSTNDAVTAGGIIDVASLQWFPDTTGNLAISGTNLYYYYAYTGTTGTSVTSASATALSSGTGIPAGAGAGVLTVASTATLPVAGTAILVTNAGPTANTVSWTGIGSATTLTGCTYTGTTSNTVITGSQLFLTTVSTGPANMAQSFIGCTSTGGGAGGITFATGMQVIGLPGGSHQASTLSNQGNIICIGPGFTLPEVVGSKMSLFSASAATAAVLTPLFAGTNPIYDGKYVELVNSRISGGSGTLTFTANGTSNGTLLALGNTTRAVTQGGLLALRWDQTILATGGTLYGEWVEIAAGNLGGHG